MLLCPLTAPGGFPLSLPLPDPGRSETIEMAWGDLDPDEYDETRVNIELSCDDCKTSTQVQD